MNPERSACCVSSSLCRRRKRETSKENSCHLRCQIIIHVVDVIHSVAAAGPPLSLLTIVSYFWTLWRNSNSKQIDIYYRNEIKQAREQMTGRDTLYRSMFFSFLFLAVQVRGCCLLSLMMILFRQSGLDTSRKPKSGMYQSWQFPNHRPNRHFCCL